MDNRVAALRKGFARINYSANKGELTVEARSKDWPNLVGPVREFVQRNIDKIDNMTVNLMDSAVKREVDSGSEQLFKLSAEEKMDRIPLISAPGEVIETSAQAGDWWEKVTGLSGQFAPMTDAGKALKDRGYEFRESAKEGNWVLQVHDNEGIVGMIHAYQTSPKRAFVNQVSVIPTNRKQGIAETLYRELAARLQEAGITSLRGNVVSEAPARIRTKLFGDKPMGTKMGTAESTIDPGAQFTPARLEDFKTEESLPRALAKPGWAVLSATQESIGPASAPLNAENNLKLAELLDSKGYPYQKITGTYKGVDQGESFLITDISPQEALELGRQFKQESVITPDGLLYSDNTLTQSSQKVRWLAVKPPSKISTRPLPAGCRFRWVWISKSGFRLPRLNRPS